MSDFDDFLTEHVFYLLLNFGTFWNWWYSKQKKDEMETLTPCGGHFLCGWLFIVARKLLMFSNALPSLRCLQVFIEIIAYGWLKILENITSGFGHHEWKYWIYHEWPKATSDKSIIFTSDDHNHKWYFPLFLPAM